MKRQDSSFADLGKSRTMAEDMHSKMRDLKLENDKLRIDLAAKDREVARRMRDYDDK